MWKMRRVWHNHISTCCWQLCYDGHAPFTEEGHSCQQRGTRSDCTPWALPQGKEQYVINETCQGTQLTLSSGILAVHSVYTGTHNTILILTLLTRFGIFDVRHSFGAQGPHGNSQLSQHKRKKRKKTTWISSTVATVIISRLSKIL